MSVTRAKEEIELCFRNRLAEKNDFESVPGELLVLSRLFQGVYKKRDTSPEKYSK